jgi:hypothetical protein
MNPLRCLGLTHPEQASMQQLRGILLEVDQNEQEPIFRGGQGTVLIGRIASRWPTPPRSGPFGHVAQERCLESGYQRSKLIHRQARQISHLGRMGGKIAIPEPGLGLLW